MASTALGLKNLARLSDMLLPAASGEPGETYDTLGELYKNMLGQWSREIGHVVNIVGGFDSVQRHVGQQGPRFTPVPAARQRQAVAFLNDNAFMPLTFAIRPDILNLVEPAGTLGRVADNQRNVLNDLLSPARLQRVIEQAAMNPGSAYQPTELLSDVRHGIWKELDSGSVNIDPYRRNIQRAHLTLLSQRVGQANATDDSRALFRGELQALDKEVNKAVRKARDPMTRLHLEDVRAEIRWALDPERPLTAAPPGGSNALTDEMAPPLSCWPELDQK